MLRRAALVLAGLWAAGAAPVQALSITGIVIYSTDDFGDPNGVSSEAGAPEAQGWRTSADRRWYVLGVYDGLLPDSLSKSSVRALNSDGSLRINIPLVEGDNYFTLVGQPSNLTETDEYARWSVNLYFDGREDDPGISVLIPRQAAAGGAPTTRTRAQTIYAFNLSGHRQRIPGVDDTEGYDAYDDGNFRVTVPTGSMISSKQVFNDGAGIDFIGEWNLVPNKSQYADFVGSLTLTVEASSGQPTTGGGGGYVGAPPVAPAQQPRAGAGQPNYNVPVPNYAGAPSQQVYDDPAADTVAPAEPANVVPKNLTPTPKDAVDLMKNWLSQGIETPTEPVGTGTPKAVAGTPTPAATKHTATPASTAKTTTPGAAGTPATTTTPVAPTPTPTPPSPTPTLTAKQTGTAAQTTTPGPAK